MTLHIKSYDTVHGKGLAHFRSSESNFARIPEHNDFDVGMGDFTIDATIQLDGNPTGNLTAIHTHILFAGDTTTFYWSFGLATNDVTGRYVLAFDTGLGGIITSADLPEEFAGHVAVERVSGGMVFYVRGQLWGGGAYMWSLTAQGDTTINANLTSGTAGNHNNLRIADLRFSVTGEYGTAAFNEVTSEFTNTANTRLLLRFNMENKQRGSEECYYHNTVRTVYDATYGGPVYEFDGSTDSHVGLDGRSNMFRRYSHRNGTIEGWVYVDHPFNTSIEDVLTICSEANADYYSRMCVQLGHNFSWDPDTNLRIALVSYEGSDHFYPSDPITIPQQTWVHWAWTWAYENSSWVHRLYWNGQRVYEGGASQADNSSVSYASSELIIGDRTATSTQKFEGRIGWLRYQQGRAKYTDATLVIPPYTAPELERSMDS
jgi:hypothetical protein